MTFKKKLIIIIGAFALLLIGWVSLEFEKEEVPFISVADLVDNHNEFTQERFRLGGTVEEGTISFSTDGLTVSFDLIQADVSVPVKYKSAAMPDLFKDNAEVIVEGAYKDGILVADNLMTKCASRYEEEENYDSNKKGRS